MNVARIIEKKRDGGELSDAEIEFVVRGFTDDRVPEYQMSSLAMAIFFSSMTPRETSTLTSEMLHSGVTLQWSDADFPCVDKHSTGGIGDKVSLILAPMLACCDLMNPMISGRGLGATGGTLDKLEAIAGFRTDLSVAEMQTVAREVGCCINGATSNLAPADQKLYALRDVTGTVPSVPLITASILSKKLAEGLDALVLDVKFGSGAFMKTETQARELAKSLVDVSSQLGVKSTALLTDMNAPLGRWIGNAVEVDESVDVLQGKSHNVLRELSIALGSHALLLTKRVTNPEEAILRMIEVLDNGRAYEKFASMVRAQGGDLEVARSLAAKHEYQAIESGIVQSINSEDLGYVVIELKGGRRLLADSLDHSTGIEMLIQVGDTVETGQPILNVLSHDGISPVVRSMLDGALKFGSESPPVGNPIVDKVT